MWVKNPGLGFLAVSWEVSVIHVMCNDWYSVNLLVEAVSGRENTVLFELGEIDRCPWEAFLKVRGDCPQSLLGSQGF